MELLKTFSEEIGCKVKENVNMGLYTSFKTGGSAKLFIEPDGLSSLAKVIGYCSKNSLKYLILGNGSNLLIKDEGIDGVVIHIADGFKDMEYMGDGVVKCGAGASLSQLCTFVLKHKLSGLEFAYGIPGSVGGAVFMNAGAYGGEMKDVIALCGHIDKNGESGSFKGKDLEFGYRKSIYAGSGCVITHALVKLKNGDPREIRFNMESVMFKRREKQPLEYPSAGSVFKRPQGHFAGALIEQCGLKGKTIGGAKVSEKHAGFIINTGGASTKDIIDLIELIKETVREKTGVVLEEEIKIIE
ncbi:MAG: UDP-N-acetylmuramate dehydrogenase [Oscillospiraceae bacterium]|nr:UDP-N-acetylmuramate dehydrogenase [Oscillospiraceae bacterium]